MKKAEYYFMPIHPNSFWGIMLSVKKDMKYHKYEIAEQLYCELLYETLHE